MPCIISTVTCLMKKNEVLANAGDEVKVVSEYGHVVIVELNGNRFSVKKDNLTNDKKVVDLTPISVKEVFKRPVAKKVKSESPTLF